MSERPIDFVALGAALSAALVAIYAACAVVALAAPGLAFTHAWLALFGGYPPLTAAGVAGAALANVAAAWLAALAFAPVYNALARGRERRI
ncbi:hypothetical protein [Chthonobacter rhizosphaerae]|uniref:hypothetical protein n=1 Tax=Chthonobacter rhizosphaerae TaxID=2735553 RepID=UPI0015EFC59A|nr:hypothetical protein [Chthonobacter rhizosphaerae]